MATRFRFRLQALQHYRESQRDRIRGWLAQLLAQDAALIQQKAAALAERDQVLAEMAALAQQNRFPVDQAANRRYRAGQLQQQALQLDQQRQQLGEQIAVVRRALVQADQGVKVLERLSEQQAAVFWAEVERQESRQREETWQAGQLAQAVQQRFAE